MSTPTRNAINIRLEIQVPDGTDLPFGGVRAFGNPEGSCVSRYVRPQPEPDKPWPVLPGTSTALGTICAKVEYDTAVNMVKAFVYPAPHYPPSPGPTFPVPLGAEDGTSNDGGFTWRWEAGKPVRGADHAPSPGAPDRLAIWFRTTGTGAFTFDGSTPFNGVTDSRPCGAGSGSTMGKEMEELTDAETLLVSILTGEYQGQHIARRVAAGKWVSKVAKDSWEFSYEAGKDLMVTIGKDRAPAKRVFINPFSASFPGRIFQTAEDVLVTVK